MTTSSQPALYSLPAARNLLLDRRRFLANTSSGLGAIALAALLQEERLLANENPPLYKPEIDPSHPHAARPAPASTKARNVLVIFCSARFRTSIRSTGNRSY